MKFENVRVYNFEGAMRGMRNPMNSWNRGDTVHGYHDSNSVHNLTDKIPAEQDFYMINWDGDLFEFISIGSNDLDLAQRLIRSGSEHRKFMRQIMVSVDITAPLYW